ncbi:MAG: hypothetical protein ABL886_09185 [Rhodoglobus sp.]
MTVDATPSAKDASPTPTPTTTQAEPRASVRWGGYAVAMIALLGLGYVLSTSWLWPEFIMPAWMWAIVSMWHGQACYATAVVLASGMVGDAADLLLVRALRLLAGLVILLAIVGFGALSVWSYQRELYLIAISAALMATVGPLVRRLRPGLPRAKARIRR